MIKTSWVFLLLIMSIAAATWLHTAKSNGNYLENDIDGLRAGIQGMQKLVPENTNISLRQFNVDCYLYTRYLLAPRYCSLDAKEKMDTILSICGADAADSVLNTIKSGRKLLWTNKDKQYQYFLTSAH